MSKEMGISREYICRSWYQKTTNGWGSVFCNRG